MSAIFWLIVVIACVAVEIMTLGLTTIWFGGGALAAFVAALFSASWWVQLVLFVIVSALLLLFTRPFAVKFLNRDTVKTNYESMAGREGIVTEQIDNLNATGEVQVGGLDWTARSEAADEVILAGTRVTVKKIDGVKLIVTPVKKEEEK